MTKSKIVRVHYGPAWKYTVITPSGRELPAADLRWAKWLAANAK